MKLRWSPWLACSLLVPLGASPASAQSSSPVAQQAAATDAAPPDYAPLYTDAVTALAAGELERARALFARAHELRPNAHTLRGMGRVELLLGNGSTAVALLEKALAATVDPLPPTLRTEAEQWLAQARQSAGPVVITGPTAPTAHPPPAPQTYPAPAPGVYAPPTVTYPIAPPPVAPVYVQPAPSTYSAPAAPPLVVAPARPAAPPPEGGPDLAGLFGLSAILPLEGYAQKTRGMGVSAALWIELDQFVIAPEIALRFDVEDEQRRYLHLVPLELGAFWIAPAKRHTVFLGPGIGMHAIFERVDVDYTIGDFIKARTVDTVEEGAFGFAVFGRLGLVLMRGAAVSVVPSVDYAVTFAELIGSSRQQAIRANVCILVGGGR